MKIRLACSLPAFDTQELAAAVEAFGEVLNGVVPGERLNDCYLYAIRHRDSTYPLAVTEIVQAWRIISADEHARRRNCSACGGAGFRMVRDPLNHDQDIQKECPFCVEKVPTALAAQ